MASPGPPERYRFGPFELQLDKRRLLKDGATISLRPRAFDLLVALVDRAGHLVTKDGSAHRAELVRTGCVFPSSDDEEGRASLVFHKPRVAYRKRSLVSTAEIDRQVEFRLIPP